ncbi:DUF5602 domain-containing protein [Gemmatirosa kalamazoonensis]|uniref:DUF5602 domain-containing protein n=1 Tax=Gemmatirosa kalamazoonensis TaxID=861299 RepID=UPI00046D59C6|nr:DUF5602 domain-containing protein [Gemmatirosa kalamazoonensis]
MTAAFLCTAGAVAFACSDSTPSTAPYKAGTFFGPVTQMAGGSGRAYITLDHAGAPTELGVALAEGALAGLPNASTEYVFVLPAQASATPYTHAVINWEPSGHMPPAYAVPHFDFHFYTIAPAEREAIVLTDPQVAAKIARLPAAEFIPAGYILGMASARMGQHWRDPSGPEFNGQPFTSTLIYGSYDGAVSFVEPMIAKSYLETKPTAVVKPIKLPAQYSVRGYQATTYTVGWDAATKEYRVALFGLVQR